MTRVVCIADTHGQHSGLKIPDGDLLIHAGDICLYGEVRELVAFNRWASYLPHQVICIAGNHDKPFERTPAEARAVLTEVIYLQDEELTIDGLRIYGSPWTPLFFDWSFMLPRRGVELKAKWDQIPEGLDILITHGPPWGKLDQNNSKHRCGCELLRDATVKRPPRYHVFGHIHPSFGVSVSEYRTFVNAAICNDQLTPINSPIVLDL